MRGLFLGIAVLLAGCYSVGDEAASDCLEAAILAPCSGAVALEGGACTAVGVDDLPAGPDATDAPRLTIAQHAADGELSVDVPLTFQELVFEESSDPAQAGIWATWIRPVADLPADTLAAPGPAATRYRLWLHWSPSSDHVDEGRLDVIDDGAESSIDLTCAD